jgi:hypothetical protein
VTIADIVMIPVQPSGLDLWAANSLTFPLCCFDQISCWLPKDTP